MSKTKKYVFITGGVVSGLGKGIAAASLGLILKSRGFRVVNQKFDPYLNIDPGTMNPLQHGEVFVTDDGAETDLDLGHYERFTDVNLSKSSSQTAGKIYLAILNREREGGYNGGTVQVIPNVTDEIRARMQKAAETDADIIITEIGGTVGDIESLPFIEACRQIRAEVDAENCCFIHLTLIPFLRKSGELKSKPTQHSVQDLQGLGIQPDVVMLRTELPIDQSTREKIALFCNVAPSSIIQNLNAQSIYEVPLMMEKEGLGDAVSSCLGLSGASDLSRWSEMVSRLFNPKREVKIALVGKYVALQDAYLSVNEALIHGGIANEAKVFVEWIDSEKIESAADAENLLSCADGIIIPGGFGSRGIEGMILAADFARRAKKPCFGICLGMQIMTISHARFVCAISDATSTEFSAESNHNVIDIMPDQNGARLGGTLRLGKFACDIKKGTKAFEAYESARIEERHRHRYEFNNDFAETLENSGLVLAGRNPDRNLVEIVEEKGHPWMVGVQFHPEFKSRPDRAHPLFKAFIRAAIEERNRK